MKKLKYFIFIFILFLTTNVFASSINSDSYSQADNFSHSSRYDYSTDNYLGDQTNFGIGSIGTSYSGKSYYFQFNFHKSITAGTIYDLKISSTTNDFTNKISLDRVVGLCGGNFSYYFNQYECDDMTIISVIRGSTSSGQSKDFTIRFSVSSNYTYWGFKIAGGLYNLTGINNFKITSIDLSEADTSNTQNIINNDNQNTQNIIDNQSSNTQSVIDNNNQNTQNIIDNQNQNTDESTYLCKTITDKSNYNWKTGYYYENNGTLLPTNNYYYATDFIKINGSTTLTFSGISGTNYHLLFYDRDFNLLSANAITSSTYNLPSNIYYIKFSLNSDNYNSFKLKTDKCIYIDKSSETANAINETNEYLKDDSDPYIADNDFLTMFNSIGFNDPLQHLLQIPVQFINALLSQSNSCQTVNLGTLWGVSLSLPCINLQNILGSGVWNTIDVLMSIGLLVVIIKNLYETFANLLTMGGEKEAREKFNMPTPMEFLSMILGGDR